MIQPLSSLLKSLVSETLKKQQPVLLLNCCSKKYFENKHNIKVAVTGRWKGRGGGDEGGRWGRDQRRGQGESQVDGEVGMRWEGQKAQEHLDSLGV